MRAMWVIWLANAIICFAGSEYLGGDALNGRVEAGHYFLSDHGRLTEVSQGVFAYSWWHHVSLYALPPLTMVIWAAVSRMKRKRTATVQRDMQRHANLE